jgi:hypothetical protein
MPPEASHIFIIFIVRAGKPRAFALGRQSTAHLYHFFLPKSGFENMDRCDCHTTDEAACSVPERCLFIISVHRFPRPLYTFDWFH